MSQKIVIVGPPGVGKTTLRKVFFEGENSSHLLKYALEPTHGQESLILNLRRNIGIFDLAGQENDRWLESEVEEVFFNTKVIIIVLDISQSTEDIIRFAEKVIKIRDLITPTSHIYLLLHKIDLIDDVELFKKQAEIFGTLSKSPYFKIRTTSIKTKYFSKTLSMFIDILKHTLGEEELFSGLDFELLKTILLFLLQFKEKDVLRRETIKNKLLLSDKKVDEIIQILHSKKHIQVTIIDNDSRIIITEKGKGSFTKILKQFDFKKLNELEGSLTQQRKGKEPPAFVGFFMADKDGKLLMNVELNDGELDEFLIPETADPNQFDSDLIPMFISALEKFSQEINIPDLGGFKLKGRNLAMLIITLEDYTTTFFFNPKIDIKSFKQEIISYLKKLVSDNKKDFEDAARTGNLEHVKKYKGGNRKWLEDINNRYKATSINLERYDNIIAETLYADLDNFQSNLDIKIGEIKDEIKKLRVDLMVGIIDEDIEKIRKINKNLIKLNRKYL